ncbi:hypothetical protein DMN91_012798 [Ooceraea biroi]|uniref:Uncharacterized protein n=1 Tax=Ooceraea biroi TaxID=2015173 RepID=A0A3L8D458_OOCBI|nr:hypothetical protein DMN91_012798 [Ooceraea biroi]
MAFWTSFQARQIAGCTFQSAEVQQQLDLVYLLDTTKEIEQKKRYKRNPCLAPILYSGYHSSAVGVALAPKF